MSRIYLLILGNKFQLGWNVLLRRSISCEPATSEISDSMRKICKILMSSHATTLDTALDQSGIRVSQEMVEEVLKRFENAGMVAYRFFQWVEKQRRYTHSVRAYHTMVESLAKIRQYHIMWDVVNAMRGKGMLNVETFCIIMRKYARVGKVDETIYAFNVMEKYGVEPNLAAFNGLLSALCKSKNVRKAQEIFDSMKDRFVPDSKTYSILIDGWGKAPNLPKAREIFREMIDVGCEQDIVTYVIIVDVLCKAGRVDEALGIVKEMDYAACRPTSFIYSILVHTYGQDDRIDDAIETFLEMEKNGIRADVVVYNALISGFCKVNRLKNVYGVLSEMESKGLVPNSRTCNIILNSLISRGMTDEAFKVFRKMIKICEPDADTYAIMIKMFCDKDELEMGLRVWKYMKQKRFMPSIHTYSVLINGHCKKGDAAQASILLEEMIERGIPTAGPTFGRLRQLLIREGREDVLKFLQEKISVLLEGSLWD